MKIRMNSNRKATGPGIKSPHFEAGQVYEAGKSISEAAARHFVAKAWATEVKSDSNQAK
ncbi:MAG: hypothetical protein KDJ19_00695 [Hyphomicrobiaceae bacterium]|nr:hypothetical protein [Hyphomicrobiaceae bacterium]MCC0024626.1 hypothetical protein [Hyphomicrobiaceae bacterium]